MIARTGCGSAQLRLVLHRVLMQGPIQLVDDGGPCRIGLDLLGQELALRIAPLGRVGEADVGAASVTR